MVRYLSLINSSDRAKVSAKDYKFLSQFRWRINCGGYVERSNDGTLLHRLITGINSTEIVVDHVDRDKLNNTRDNLRPATFLENSYNRTKNKNNILQIKNVGYDGRYNIARVRIQANKSKRKYVISLSLSKLELVTTLADLMMIRLHGDFSATNRPLSYYRENDPYSMFPSELEERVYHFVSPEGVISEGGSLRQLSRSHGFPQATMSRVVRGVKSDYMGWTAFYTVRYISLGDFADKLAVDKVD